MLNRRQIGTLTEHKSHTSGGTSPWFWNFKLREGTCPVLPVTAASISNNTHLSWTLAETESATPFIGTMGWPLLHISNVTHKWHLHWFLHWPGTTHIHNADVSSYPIHHLALMSRTNYSGLFHNTATNAMYLHGSLKNQTMSPTILNIYTALKLHLFWWHVHKSRRYTM